MEKVDRATYEEAKVAQDEEVTTKGVAESLEITLEQANEIFVSKNWENYIGEKNEVKVEKILPATLGHYKSLIAKKEEENGNLKENRDWLLEQVYFLRKTVAFLEGRKGELESGIKNMEKQIVGGLSAIEQIESSDNFKFRSEEVKRRTKRR